MCLGLEQNYIQEIASSKDTEGYKESTRLNNFVKEICSTWNHIQVTFIITILDLQLESRAGHILELEFCW